MKVIKNIRSTDESIKYLLKLDDEYIESVYIPQPEGVNLCISSQIGCVNKCKHCATGRIQYIRDLSSEEIINQVKIMLKEQRFVQGKVKLLFMGMGEPLLNYKEVMRAIRMFSQETWLQNTRDIIISTSGIVEAICQLASEEIRPKLAITIGAVSEEKRNWLLVPIGKLFSLSVVTKVAREYITRTNDDIIFQYPLIKDFNDSIEEAKTLTNLIKNIPSEVHLIQFNEFKESQLKRPTEDIISNFYQYLNSEGIKVFIKRSFGIDINAGCGQLTTNLHIDKGDNRFIHL